MCRHLQMAAARIVCARSRRRVPEFASRTTRLQISVAAGTDLSDKPCLACRVAPAPDFASTELAHDHASRQASSRKQSFPTDRRIGAHGAWARGTDAPTCSKGGRSSLRAARRRASIAARSSAVLPAAASRGDVAGRPGGNTCRNRRQVGTVARVNYVTIPVSVIRPSRRCQ